MGAACTLPQGLNVLLTLIRWRRLAALSVPEEVCDVNSQSVRDEQQVRELRVPDGVLVSLDRPAFHAGEVCKLLLR